MAIENNNRIGNGEWWSRIISTHIWSFDHHHHQRIWNLVAKCGFICSWHCASLEPEKLNNIHSTQYNGRHSTTVLCARTYNPKLQQSDMKLFYFLCLLRAREEREPEQEDSEEVENEARIKNYLGSSRIKRNSWLVCGFIVTLQCYIRRTRRIISVDPSHPSWELISYIKCRVLEVIY